MKMTFLYLNFIFRYMKMTFPYLKLIFLYLKSIFRSMKMTFLYLKLIFRCMKLIFLYLKSIFRSMKMTFLYLKLIFRYPKLTLRQVKCIFRLLYLIFPLTMLSRKARKERRVKQIVVVFIKLCQRSIGWLRGFENLIPSGNLSRNRSQGDNQNLITLFCRFHFDDSRYSSRSQHAGFCPDLCAGGNQDLTLCY